MGSWLDSLKGLLEVKNAAKLSLPEAAQDMANHSDPRTTKRYDRRVELANLSEIKAADCF